MCRNKLINYFRRVIMKIINSLSHTSLSLQYMQKLVHLLLILLCWSNNSHPGILKSDQVEYGMKHTTLKARNDLKELSKLFQHCYQLYTVTNEFKAEIETEGQVLEEEATVLKQKAESLWKSWLLFNSRMDIGLSSLRSREEMIQYLESEKENANALIETGEFITQISRLATKVTNWNDLAMKKYNQFATVFQNCIVNFKVGVGAAQFLLKHDKDDTEPFIPEVFEQVRTLLLELTLLGSRLGSFIIPDEKSFIQFIILKEDYMRLEEEILTRIKMFEKNLWLVNWSRKNYSEVHKIQAAKAEKTSAEMQKIHHEFVRVSTSVVKLFRGYVFEQDAANGLGCWDREIRNERGDDFKEKLKTFVLSQDFRLEEKAVLPHFTGVQRKILNY